MSGLICVYLREATMTLGSRLLSVISMITSCVHSPAELFLSRNSCQPLIISDPPQPLRASDPVQSTIVSIDELIEPLLSFGITT